MLLVSTDTLTAKKYVEIGFVKATSVYSKNLAKDIGQSLKSVVGGELKGYTDLLDTVTDIVIQKLEDKAAGMGADAVLGIHYATSNLTEYGAEIIAYGTAVKFVE
ncbi:MAG: YbjQ family protein [Peptococcaceae bacterium]|nr:YbjQ family protein [Peptococcaceae bacterium]